MVRFHGVNSKWWRSKLGTGVLIWHRLSELEGGRYGRIVAYYALPRATAHQDPSGLGGVARDVQ